MHVSVVIPTYNRAELLREALESVFQQTCKQLEIIVVDDGSNDHTEEVLAEFGNRIQSIRLGRSGISTARNMGIDAATGDYIAFLDSDDLWTPTKIEQQMLYASVHPDVTLTYTDAIQFTSSGPENTSFAEHFPDLRNPSHLFSTMVTKFSIPLTSTVIIKTAFLKETGLRFPTEIGIGEDLGLFLQILAAGGTFSYLPEKLTLRRMHDSNISGNHCRRFEQRKLLYSSLLQQSADYYTPEQKSVLKLGLRDATYRVAECDWEKDLFSKARQGFLQALSIDRRGVQALTYALLTLLPSAFIDKVRSLKKS